MKNYISFVNDHYDRPQVAEPVGEYPSLPKPDFPYIWGGAYSENQMLAFVDADRAMREQAAPAAVAPNWTDAANWLRNNYQDYPNIASLCEGMIAASPFATSTGTLPINWENAMPGGKYTDKWESSRVADYNRGWNDYRKESHKKLKELTAATTAQAKEGQAMNDTTSAAPSDAEIDARWRESVEKHETTAAFVRDFARAVLAKWGTPQPVAREPLTDGQIAEMMRETWGCASIAPRHALEFARAVERAHGIAQKGGAAALDCHHRPPCDECAAYDTQRGNK